MESASPDNFQTVRCSSAEELLRLVAPICSLDTGTPSPRFIFRGQGDANQQLIPKALRRHSQDSRTIALRLLDRFALKGAADDQVWAEIHLLKMFLDACDQSSIAVPGDDYETRSTWLDDQVGPLQGAYLTPSKWPFPAHLPMLAFAQHHGVPTRLLDWTRSGSVAAYFAAADAVYTESSGELVVWALNIELIHLYPRLQVVLMPGANSPRLGAQKGLFTLVRPDSRRSGSIGEIALPDALTGPNADIRHPKPLWKLVLSATEARRLLYLCHLQGIDAGSIHLGAEGAARAVTERASWSRVDPETGRSAATERPPR